MQNISIIDVLLGFKCVPVNYADYSQNQLSLSVIVDFKICLSYIMFKACVHYFLSNFYFSPNDSPSETM